MTLYDIVLERQDTYEQEEPMRGMRSKRPGIKLTVRVTPWLPLIVPPGSTLVINRDGGPEAMMTGPNVAIVTRGDECYTNSRIIDGYSLECLNYDAPYYLAAASEQLLQEAIRRIAEIKVEEMTK